MQSWFYIVAHVLHAYGHNIYYIFQNVTLPYTNIPFVKELKNM